MSIQTATFFLLATIWHIVSGFDDRTVYLHLTILCSFLALSCLVRDVVIYWRGSTKP